MRSPIRILLSAPIAILLLAAPPLLAAPAPPAEGVAALSLEQAFADRAGYLSPEPGAQQAQYFDNRPPQRTQGTRPYSQPIVGQRGPNHDSGFLLRLSLGLGGAQTRYSESGAESLRLSGFGIDWNLAIGGFVAPNFAIHGTLLGFYLPSPDISAEGITVSTNIDTSMNAFGGGVTWYFMPANVYLSSSIGLGYLSLSSGDAYGETNVGVAGDVVIGKEWFTGPRWGVGLAGAFTWHSFPDALIDSRWRGGSATLRFTATFNP